MKGVFFVAPNEKAVMSNRKGEKGAYVGVTEQNVDALGLLPLGKWNYFYDGELLYSQPGNDRIQDLPNSFIDKVKFDYSETSFWGFPRIWDSKKDDLKNLQKVQQKIKNEE